MSTTRDQNSRPGGVKLPPELRAVVAEVPNLKDECSCLPQLVVACAPSSPGAAFGGAALYESVDGGTTWDVIKVVMAEAVMGVVSGTIGGGVSGRFLDRENTITVILDDEFFELSSEPSEVVAAGRRNWLWAGGEIIAFETATLVGERTYELTNLYRGRRNTEFFIDQHGADETFFMLTGSGIGVVERGLDFINTPRQYKVVQSGRLPVDVDEVFYTTGRGIGMAPFSPYAMRAARDSTGNVTLTWERRSREKFRLLGGIIAPETDGVEQYQIDVVDTGTETIYRTLVPDPGDRDVEYSAADQTTDFGSAQSSIEFRSYKMHEVSGRGNVVEDEL